MLREDDAAALLLIGLRASIVSRPVPWVLKQVEIDRVGRIQESRVDCLVPQERPHLGPVHGLQPAFRSAAIGSFSQHAGARRPRAGEYAGFFGPAVPAE